MRVPQDAVIPKAKLTHYLLVFRHRNDKSKFLSQAGFTAANSEALDAALRHLISLNEASKGRVEGVLHGVNGVNLNVMTIWLCRNFDRQFWLITLIPKKESGL